MVKRRPNPGISGWIMNFELNMQKSGAYVVSQHTARGRSAGGSPPPALKPAVTISHQSGCGAPQITALLAQILRETALPGVGTWKIFDQQLIERALQEQRWPGKLAEKIREEKRFFINELMDDLFNLRPPSWVLIPQVVETTLRLAAEGQAILIGHGVTVVTAGLPNVFHVRLTGSLPRRIERVEKFWNMTPAAAAQFVRKEDRNREKYLKAHFRARLNNELLYDLAINTDRLSDIDAAEMIAEGARRFFSAT